MDYDVFNGDADGICALLQLRLETPKQSQLITGIKRDISLLKKVTVQPGDQVVVLDISMDKNQDALARVLKDGATVFYVDHHQATEIPTHPGLTAIIDTGADTCTSLLVDAHLRGKYRTWAITAAFGDNLEKKAAELAKETKLDEKQTELLKQLGICINYNGYGSCLDDLFFAPDRLFKEMLPFSSPFDFISANKTIFEQLLSGYRDDLNHALAIKPEFDSGAAAVFILPDEIWARRVSGTFANELANRYPQRAHAILTFNNEGGYLVSVRASQINKTGADTLCASFATGGGRKAAAGINHLPLTELPKFIEKLALTYP